MKKLNVINSLMNIGLPQDFIKKNFEDINDKVWLYGKSIKETGNGRYRINIDIDDCLVFANETVKENLLNKISDKNNIAYSKIYNSPIISHIRKGETKGVLLSAGMIPIMEDSIIMIERDSLAPTEPNKWQFPAGRSESIFSKVIAEKEVKEEISVIEDKSEKILNIKSSLNKDDINISINIFNFQKNGKTFFTLRDNSVSFYDSDNKTLEQYHVSYIEKGNYKLKDNEFDRNVSFVPVKDLLEKKIKTVNVIDKQLKSILNRIFNDKTKEENFCEEYENNITFRR